MKRLISSFKYAFYGFRQAGKQPNLRIHFLFALVVVALAFYLNVSRVDWCILLLCIGLVISLELLNTAIEGIVDLISPERQVKAGRVKDIAAAAVLFSAILSGSIGVVIFANYLL